MIMSGTGNASFFRSLPLIQVINTPKPVSRDLSVAYGVLPDPVDGMKLFSVSDALDALASGRRHELFFTDEWSFDGEALRGDDGEWCREQQFIGIDSPDRYDGYMSGDDSQSVFGVLDFSLPTDRLEIKIQKEGRPITKTCKNIQSPSSVLTFAALWDPDTGFTAYEKGKLLSRHKTRNFAGHRPFNPLVDTSVSNLPTTHLYHPRVSESRMHNHAIPSSTLEGLADPWHFPFFDPLSVPAEFKEPNSSVRFQVRFSQEGVYLSDCIDPEGFFESFADHPDCEPYLRSRFSATTTSNSNHVDVNFRASNRPFPGLLVAPNHSAALPHTENSRSFKQEKWMSRLSRAIKGRWCRHAHDEQWVFVEVQTVITDRILKE